MQATAQELLTPDELSTRLKCSKEAVLNAMRKGTIRPAVRISRKVILFDPNNLQPADTTTATSN